MGDETDDVIEIGESVDVAVLTDDDGEVLGAVVDDVIVATSAEGSIIDETIDIIDEDGRLVLEDETVSVFDADANLVSQEETVAIALDDE
ncbi:MAG: hypothetical protein Q8M17_07805 [Actinomycetota bacterium]|nr:hypothetical protein [Actinomycetota bacterium]